MNAEIKILDIKINPLSKTELIEQIRGLLLSDDVPHYQLVTTNPEFIVCAQGDPEFKNIINNSWLSVADGYGIRLAAKYLDLIKNKKNIRYPLFIILNSLFIGLKVAYWGITRNEKKLDIVAETITGVDLLPEICQLLSVIPAHAGISWTVNKKVFFLGGYDQTAKLAAENIQNMVVTRFILSPEIAYAPFEKPNIIEKINSFSPAVLFVALSHPRAQKWLAENLPLMPSVKLAIGVGGAFDYLSGKIKRAPKSWQRSYEWLYRLATQPKRIIRIWRAVMVFSWLIFYTSLKDQLSRQGYSRKP